MISEDQFIINGRVLFMTRVKGSFGRLLSLLTAFMVLLSCIPVTAVNARENDSRDPQETNIREFFVDFLEGAEERDGQYIWTATTVQPGHKFIYYIHFALSGKDYFTPGEIRITVPKRLLLDRRGEYSDELEVSVPPKEEVEEYDGEFHDDDNQFQYEIIGDNAVITNHRNFSAAMTGYIELAYVTNKTSFEYEDMKMSDSFWSRLELLDSDSQVIQSVDDTAPPVGIDTFASMASTYKRTLNINHQPYQSWDSSWGRAPDNADDYYYLMWEIKSWVNACTQPYDLNINDFITQGTAEPIAYRFQGESRFTSSPTRRNNRDSDYWRYDYVITRHPKSVYQDLESYTITNKEIITLTPVDRKDDPTSFESAADFTYYKPHFTAPGEYVYSAKWGNNNWYYRFNYYWDIADYGLQELKDGEVDHLSGNIKFFVEDRAYLLSHTMEEGADREDIESYGKRKVKYTVTDDRFYLNDHIYIRDDQAVIDNSERALTWKDFDIEYVNYYISMWDGYKDDDYNTIVSGPVRYREDDIICFYAKFKTGDWIKVAEYNKYTGEPQNVLSDYVSSLTENKIVFARNCVAYRIETENPHFATHIDCYPYLRVKNSAYILSQSENVNKIQLTNISNFTVVNDKAQVLYNKDSMATDYIIGVVKESKIEKEVAFTTSNALRRFVTVGWRVEIDEHYMTNDGVVYIPQDTGVFYDLLPIGNLLDKKSVAVGIDYGQYYSNIKYLKSYDYEVSSIVNYKNTGRTLLIVRIKTQFKRAMLTYNTVYSWDSAMDYGTTLLNTIAFETGNDKISGGHPDDGGDIGIEDKEIMSDLDPDTDDRKFIYEQKLHPIRFLISTRTGLVKSVNNAKSTDFSSVTEVGQGADYVYKLRYNTTIVSRAKDMVLYDSLENFVSDGHESEWHGTLQAVDVIQPTELGIAPVVYYSDRALDIEHYHDIDNDTINGEKVWKTESEFGDISRAKAVAVDLRHDPDGNDFVLGRKSSVVVHLYMKAPEEDTSGSVDPVCFNNIYIDDTVIDIFDEEKPHFIHHDNTEVHFRVMGSFGIEKVDSKNENTLIKGISFNLRGAGQSGASDYGTPVNITMTTDANGRLRFDDIEKGSYILKESAGSADYLRLEKEYEVVIEENGNVRIDGMLVPEGTYYRISDEPRIHTDIEFLKKDLDTFEFVEGAKFRLQGTSNYYPDLVDGYVDTRISDIDGKVSFTDVEWGEYTLREIEVPEGYALSGTVYNVIVDLEGHFTITVSETEGEGDTDSIKRANSVYSIYNEPLHSFTIQKVSSTTQNPVMARYQLTNQATQSSLIQTTAANGRATFAELPSGEYWLQEIEVLDEGYNLDETPYFVHIDKHGNVTIQDHEMNAAGNFVMTDSPNGSVTVIKKWDDNETTQSRLENGITPTIHLSSDITEPAAYFTGSISNAAPRASANNVKTFKPFGGDLSVVEAKINDGTAKKMDDNSTDYYIYAWDETGNGDIVWYSNAVKVYVLSSRWSQYTQITSIDCTGLDTSLAVSMQSWFYNCQSLKSLNIKSFDTSNVIDMRTMFCNCLVLEKLELGDKFDTSRVIRMDFMFSGCPKLVNAFGENGNENRTGLDVSGFNTENVIGMSGMFQNCSGLEFIDVSGFDTSRVITMDYMFQNCSKLKNLLNEDGTQGLTGLDVSGFDTSEVTTMLSMFQSCNQLEFIDVSGFDTARCTSMQSMFRSCSKLRNVMDSDGTRRIRGLDVRSFDTSYVNDMSGMFCSCQKLQFIDIEGFDTSRVCEMNEMFHNCQELINKEAVDGAPAITGLDVSGFDTSCATSMAYMFCKLYNVEFIPLGDGFSTECVTSMERMFSDCSKLTFIDLSGFDTSLVRSLTYMFNGCVALQSDDERPLDFSGFNTEAVTNMNCMFCNCKSVKRLDVQNFDTANVTNMSNMFDQCYALEELDLSRWSSDMLTEMAAMFREDRVLKSITFGPGFTVLLVTNMNEAFSNCYKLTGLDLKYFNTVTLEQAHYLFSNCREMTRLDIRGLKTHSCFDISFMFAGCYELSELNIPNDLDLSCCGSLTYVFQNCKKLETLDMKNWKTDSVSNMAYVFQGCTSLKTVRMDNINTCSVTSMAYMFAGCTSLESIDLSFLDLSSVQNMEHMFNGCSELKTVDMHGLNTVQLKSLAATFYNCKKLESVDMSGMDTHRIKNMGSTFYYCNALTEISGLKDFDTANLTSLEQTFRGCQALTILDLSSWYIPKLVNMNLTFCDCTNLEKIYVSVRWHFNNPNSNSQTFSSCSSLEGQDGTTYNWTRSGSDYAVIDDAAIGVSGYFSKSDNYNVYPTVREAYFSGANFNTFWNSIPYSPRVNEKKFKHYTGSASSVEAIVSSNTTAKRVDDNDYDFKIYAWFDSSDKTVYWWSDIEEVYLPSTFGSWNSGNYSSIDLSGIDFSRVKIMRNMFSGNRLLTSLDMSDIDTSNVRSMAQMFNDCSNMTELKLVRDDGTTAFDVSRVIDMRQMFFGCGELRSLDLSLWDTSSVSNMSALFRNCYKLSSLKLKKNDGTGGFDTSSARDMSFLLNSCTNITELDVSDWDTSHVYNMSHTFYNMAKASIKLTRDDGTSAFVTDNVYNFRNLFNTCKALTSLDLRNFNTSKVVDMQGVFSTCINLTSLDVSSFDTSNVVNMQTMFYSCSAVTELQLGDNFDTGKVLSTRAMFERCNALKKIHTSSDPASDRNVAAFDTSRVVVMERMFVDCNALEEADVSTWDTSRVRLIESIFCNCMKIKKLAVEGFDLSRVSSLREMFYNCELFEGVDGILDLSDWNISRVNNMSYMFCMDGTRVNRVLKEVRFAKPDGTAGLDASRVRFMRCMFNHCQGLKSMDVSDLRTHNLVSTREMFSYCRGLTSIKLARDDGTTSFNTEGVLYFCWMFRGCSTLPQLDVSSLDTSHAVTMRNMFNECTKLESVSFTDESGSTRFDTSQVRFMTAIFNNCRALKRLDLSCFDTSRTVNAPLYNDTGMEYGGDGGWGEGMFRYCWELEEIVFGDKFTTEYMVSFDYMFGECKKLKSVDLPASQFKTGFAFRMDGMFASCEELEELNISHFDTSHIRYMQSMFSCCRKLRQLDLSDWDTGRVEDMNSMFHLCESMTSLRFVKDSGESKFDTMRVKNMKNMFREMKNYDDVFDLSVFNTTRVSDMTFMFYLDMKLKGIIFGREFKAQRTISTDYMFADCRAIEELDVSGFDTSMLTSMTYMFYNARALKSIKFNKDNGTSTFDISNVIYMESLFRYCVSLTELDLSSFSPVSVKGFYVMFYDCPSLETIYVSSDRWHLDSFTGNLNNHDVFAAQRLKGQNGTAYASATNRTRAVYAVVDTPETPGYFTEIEEAPELTSTAARGGAVVSSYTSEDDVCSVEYRNDDTWIYTFSGIDTTVNYYAWEDMLENYISDHMGKYNAVEVDNAGYATILNTTTIDPPEYGSLSLKKLLAAEEGAELTELDNTKVFSFVITITDEQSEPLEGAALYGSVGFTDGRATVNLRGGEEKLLTNIPAGYHYSIVEAEYDNYVSSYTGNAEGVIVKDETAEVIFTNTKKHVEEEELTAELTLKKLVTGNYEIADDSYMFIVAISGLHKNEKYSTTGGVVYTTNALGEAEVIIRLKDGESDSFVVPDNARFRITEEGGSKFTSAYSVEINGRISSQASQSQKGVSLTTGSITAKNDQPALVTFTNTRDIRQSLRLRKTVVGGSDDSLDSFTFDAEFTGFSPNETVSTSIGNPQADDNGALNMTFSIKAGEVSFYDLPVGVKYRFKEYRSDCIAAYELTDAGGKNQFVTQSASNTVNQSELSTSVETVNEGEEVTVNFINTKVSHDITVKKKLDMSHTTLSESEYNKHRFSFVVRMIGLEAGKEYRVNRVSDSGVPFTDTFTGAEGVTTYSIDIRNGQSFTIKELPLDATYTVTEEADRFYIASYRVTANSEAVVAKNEDSNTKADTSLRTAEERVDASDMEVIFTFTNTYTAAGYELPNAGMEDAGPVIMIFFGGLILFGAAILFINSRKNI